MTTALSLLGVSKNYGGAQALVSVDVDLRPGRVHALVGENGAGKSTATKILAGLESPSAGTVLVDSAPVTFGSRADSIARGIGLVPQHVSLIPEFTLVENFLLTQPHRLTRRAAARTALREAAARAGLSIDLSAPVANLGLAERQLGEIAIALAQGATTLLLDEPTSALGPFETAGLFERIRSLAAEGASVLLITHRLDEVRSIADDVTVLSHGRVALDAAVDTVTDDELVTALVGSIAIPERIERTAGETVRLSISGASARTSPTEGIFDVTLEVRESEIVGVLGVAGNGQRTLADVASGTVAPHSGRVLVDGTDVAGNPARALAAHVAYVPELRSEAVLPDAPLTWSAIVTSMGARRFVGRWGIRWSEAVAFTRALLDHHDVRPRNPQLSAGALSGGNQQKLLVGRELDGGASVAVLHAPTQGLDITASAAIRGEITSAARQGTAVLLISADLDEVRELADRVIVLSRGRVSDSFDIADFDVARVGRAMSGLTRAESS